jgi:uncharacterized protein
MMDLGDLDWGRLIADLDGDGFATTGPLLTKAECAALSACYDDDGLFRSRVVMARHGFGSGEYKYFQYPLPGIVEDLRDGIYPSLAPLANRWAEAMRQEYRYPNALKSFTRRCHDAGQTKPTPLLLRYGAGDYNRLHRDLYGPLAFPIQMTVLLSDPGAFEGGEFMLVENRPRMQARGEVITLGQGEAVLFAVDQRPVQGTRGTFRVSTRHGVSRLRAGGRHTLGVIFHDAA